MPNLPTFRHRRGMDNILKYSWEAWDHDKCLYTVYNIYWNNRILRIGNQFWCSCKISLNTTNKIMICSSN